MLPPRKMGYSTVRWWIVGILFLATVINYIDRQTLSILSATLRTELNLTDADYANAVSAFLFSYLIMYTVSGRLIDRFGVRLGVAVCITWWSIAAALTGFTRGATSLAFFRLLLGIGEPGIFPAGVKACGEWFPKGRRALATGIFSSGSAIGAIIAAPLIAWLTLNFGWRTAFVIPGILGLLWLPLWLAVYRHPSRHPAVTPADLAQLDAGTPDGPRPAWRDILRQRSVWGLVLSRIASDPVWYFYLFWLPDYLQRIRHLSLAEIGLYGWIPFLFADLGCVFGGMASDRLIRRGWPAARARFAVLCSVALLAPFGAMVGFMESTAAAIAVTCMITFLCQAWSTNIATLSADLTSRAETGTVMGMMGTAGSAGGLVFAQVLGFTIATFGYSSAFGIAAAMHPVALLTLFLFLRPILRRAKA
ncbi:MAG: MFS transporter [Opitutaceae bacterium]|nr:MFS transporter [Opitutaceae bacterium]